MYSISVESFSFQKLGFLNILLVELESLLLLIIIQENDLVSKMQKIPLTIIRYFSIEKCKS